MQDTRTKETPEKPTNALDTVEVDPGVLRRRPLHIACARWLAKWHNRNMITFVVIGFFFLFLPIIFHPWRSIVERIPPLSWIFGLSKPSIFWPWMFACSMFASFLHTTAKNYPGGWDVAKKWRYPSPKEVVEKSLYPQTRKEELAFWADWLGTTIVGESICLYYPFGVIAVFVRMGE